MSGRARAAAGISSLGSTENFSRPGRVVSSPAPLRAACAMSLSHYPGTGTTEGRQKSHVFLDRQVARFDPHRRPVTADQRHLESRAGNPRLRGATQAGNNFPLAPAGPAQVSRGPGLGYSRALFGPPGRVANPAPAARHRRPASPWVVRGQPPTPRCRMGRQYFPTGSGRPSAGLPAGPVSATAGHFLDRPVARLIPHQRPVTVYRRHLGSRAGNPRLHGAARAGKFSHWLRPAQRDLSAGPVSATAGHFMDRPVARLIPHRRPVSVYRRHLGSRAGNPRLHGAARAGKFSHWLRPAQRDLSAGPVSATAGHFMDRQVARLIPHRRPFTVHRRHLGSRAGNPRLHGATRAGKCFPTGSGGPSAVFPRARYRLQLGGYSAAPAGPARFIRGPGLGLGRAFFQSGDHHSESGPRHWAGPVPGSPGQRLGTAGRLGGATDKVWPPVRRSL